MDLLTLSTSAARVQYPGSPDPVVVPMDDFVSLQRAAPSTQPSAKFVLLLHDGDRIPGEPSKVSGEQLMWNNSLLGEIPFPLASIVAIIRGGDSFHAGESPKQDILTLSNGDTVTGVFTDYSDGKITMQTESGNTSVPISTASRIIFASTASTTAPVDRIGRGFQIKLNDGSQFTVGDLQVAAGRLTLTLATKPAHKADLPLDFVQSIEQLNGPLAWLSLRDPIENEQIPFFPGSAVWPAQMDRSVDGAPLRFKSETFDHGIGVHSYSRLTYEIEPGWKSFRTQYAIEASSDAPRPLADITVRIQLDRKTVYEQNHIRPGVLSPVLSIPLQDAKRLTLEADYGSAGDTQGHFNWLQPALMR